MLFKLSIYFDKIYIIETLMIKRYFENNFINYYNTILVVSSSNGEEKTLKIVLKKLIAQLLHLIWPR